MDGIEFKELFKVAVETLREKTITPLLEADATYQEDSENEGIAENALSPVRFNRGTEKSL